MKSKSPISSRKTAKATKKRPYNRKAADKIEEEKIQASPYQHRLNLLF